MVLFVERVPAEIVHIDIPTAHHPEREGERQFVQTPIAIDVVIRHHVISENVKIQNDIKDDRRRKAGFHKHSTTAVQLDEGDDNQQNGGQHQQHNGHRRYRVVVVAEQVDVDDVVQQQQEDAQRVTASTETDTAQLQGHAVIIRTHIHSPLQMRYPAQQR